MSYVFRCDRCRRLFTSEYGLLVVSLTRIEKERKLGRREDVKHYCPFCSTIFDWAVEMVDGGIYGGTRSSEEPLGWQLPHRESFDPLVNPRAQMGHLDNRCDPEEDDKGIEASEKEEAEE